MNSICEHWEGRTVDGRFPLLEWLGGWADQCVFLTVRQAMQTANIKLIFASGADAEAYQAKWETARTLAHPNLLKVMESGQCAMDGKDLVYVVTERADAVLSERIPRKALNPSTASAILEPIVDALAFLHEKGFVHGRVKPLNIARVGEQWKLSLEELIGKSNGEAAAGEPGAYDAPEVVSGRYTPACDVWSLGIIVVEAFTQQVPEAAENGSRPVPDSLPAPFLEIARRCLRRDPAERCSIADVRAILARNAVSPSVAEPAQAEPESRVAPVEVKPVRVAEEKQRPEPSLPFEDAEPYELTPRSRLFSNIEEQETRRSRLVPILFGLVILIGAGAVVGVREYRVKSLRVGDVLNGSATSQTSAPNPQHDQQQQDQHQAQSPAANAQGGSQDQGTANPDQKPPQSTTAAKGAAPRAQAPAEEQKPAAQTAQPSNPVPAPSATPQAAASAPETATETKPAAPTPARAVNAEGAVLKRVLPNVAPGARASMQRPLDIQVRVSVNDRGAVSSAEYMTQGPGNYFARVAHDAARSWKFTPPERGGQPRPSVWLLRFHFDRRNTEATATEMR